MKPVRWGVLGVSNHFIRRILPALKRCPMVELHGIASRSAEKAREAAERFGLSNTYPSYQALVEDPGLEAVYIPLPNHLHAEWIKACAQAGKHILCEKPLAMSAAEAEESARTAEKGGVKLMEAFMYRFHPQWPKAQELVRHGEIGALRAVHTVFTYQNPDPKNIRNILETGGGGLRDIGCYAVSGSRYLFEAEPRRVISLVERDPVSGTDILFSGMLDFAQGRRALFTVGTRSFPSQEVTACGSAGRISFQIPFNTYADTAVALNVTTSIGARALKLGPADQYGLQFEAFSRSVREGLAVPTPPEDAVRNQKVLDALFASEKSGTWEKV